jgi:hypothetical protein
VVWTFAIITVVFSLWNLPTYRAHAGPTADAFAMPVVRDLDSQMDGLEQYGPLLYDFSGVFFAEPYSTPIMAELQRRGIPFVVDVEGLVRQLGEERRYDGTNARYRIFYRWGEDAENTPPGATRIANHHALGVQEHYQFSRIKEQIADAVRAGQVRLTPKGERAVRSGEYQVLARALRGDASADDVFRSRQFVSAFRDGIIAVQPPLTARFRRYVELQRKWDKEEVAIFVAPL